MFLCYVIFFTIPHWNTLVTQEIAKHRGKTGTIVFLYFLFLLAEAAFNLLYFVIIERAGALLAGVLQGLRAVCVFAFSSVFFCHLQHSQCFDLFKALSTLIVVGGVMVLVYFALGFRLVSIMFAGNTLTHTYTCAHTSSHI